jgi:hypothetical protein
MEKEIRNMNRARRALNYIINTKIKEEDKAELLTMVEVRPDEEIEEVFRSLCQMYDNMDFYRHVVSGPKLKVINGMKSGL